MKRFFFTIFTILFLCSQAYASPPSGGAESFNELGDAPASYTGQGGKTVTVKVDETGVEFSVPAGGGDMLKATFDADTDDDIDLGRGGTGAALADPNADRIMFWDDSAGAVTWLTAGNGLVFSTTTLNLDLTPTAGSATLQYNDDALTVKYDATMFGEGASGLEIDVTPGAAFATLVVADDAVSVKYDATMFGESANGLILDVTPGAAFATLVVADDAVSVKYDTTLTEGANGLGVSNTLVNANLAAGAAIAFSKLATLTSGNILVGSAGNVATSVAMSGDISIIASGATAIGANKVNGTHISITDEATGDLMIYNTVSGNWERLAAGTGNYPLVSSGAVTAPAYAQLTATGIANTTITGGKLANNTIDVTQLSATLTFADGDLIDLSGITPTGAAAEGLIIPTWVDVTPSVDKPFITYDPASNSIKVYEGGWVSISGGSGAPTDATYLTLTLNGTLSGERSIAAGTGIAGTDAGANSTYTLAFAANELGDVTWGTGSAATQAWTFDGSGASDPVITVGDGYVAVTTGELRESTRRVYSVGGTDVAVADGGTAKSSWTQYALLYASATTTLSEIAIGTAGYTLNVNGTTNGYTWTAPLTMDTITDGSSYQKVAAADVDASSHVNRFYDSDGTGYITVTGLSGASAKTFSDGAKTVMELGETYGGLIFGDTYPPDAAGEIGYDTGVLAIYDGTASRTVMLKDVAQAGLIFGADTTPSTAGEIAYNASGVQYYDTAARTLMTLETAQNISGVKEVQDNTNFNFGNDADWSVYYDETTNDQLVVSTAKTTSAASGTAMVKILVNSAAGTLTDGQNVFEVMNNATSLFKVDENGYITAKGFTSSAGGADESYISMGGNTGGRAPTASAYEIYFDGGTELSYNLNGTEKTVARLQDAQTFTGAKSFTGGLYLGDTSTLGAVRIYDASSNYWTIQSQAMSVDPTLVLPTTAGTTGQYLTTTTAGNTATLSWGTPSATAAGDTAGMVQINATGTGGALAGDAGFIFTAATDTLTIGEAGAAGKLVLTDGTYTATIQQGSQSGAVTITLPISSPATLSATNISETFAGIKTFSANPVITGNNPHLQFDETDGTDWWFGLDDTGNTLEFRTNSTVGNSVVMELNEDGTGLTIGDNGDDDITLTFNANSNDGTIQWMEDEEEFRIASSGGESLYVDLDTGTANEIQLSTGSSADTVKTAMAIKSSSFVTGLMPSVVITKASGTADASSTSDNICHHSDDSAVTNAFVGMTIYNVTDSTSCTVTANDNASITCAAGAAMSWDDTNVYQIGPGPYQAGSAFYVSQASTIRHPDTVGYVAAYYVDGAIALTIEVAATMTIVNATASAIDAGDTIDSPSTAGSFIMLHNKSATSGNAWGKNGTWTDGGAT